MPYLTPDMIAAAQGNFTPAQPPPPNAAMSSSMPLDPNAGMSMPLQGGASYDPGMGGQSQAPLVTPQAMNPAPVDMGPSPDEVAAARGLFTPSAGMSQAEPNMSPEPPPPPPQQTPSMLNGWQGGMPSPMQGTAPPIAQPPRAAPQGGGGSSSLAQAVKNAQQGVLGNYDTQAGAVRAEGEAQAAKSEGTSALMTAQLDHQDKLDAISREQALNAQTKNAEYLQGTQNLIDEVASQKIDPNHFFNTGDQKRDLAVGIGALIIGAAGVWAGQGTGKNPGLDVINGLINKDIETQERNIANKRTAIQARQSMYGQLREQAGDKLLADDKFRLASLEAAKNRIIAFGAGADSKIDRARTEIAVNQVTGEQKKLWLSITERSKALADAAAAAQASSQAHRAQQQFENTVKVRQLELEGRKVDAEVNKANGGGEAAVKRANEANDKQQFTDEALRFLGNMKNSDAVKKNGILAGFAAGNSHVNPEGETVYESPSPTMQRLMPDSTKVVTDLNALNLEMFGTAGKSLKDSEGRIPPPIIAEIHKFGIKPGDTPEMAEAKINGLARFIAEQGRQSGSRAPAPDSTEAAKAASHFTPINGGER